MIFDTLTERLNPLFSTYTVTLDDEVALVIGRRDGHLLVLLDRHRIKYVTPEQVERADDPYNYTSAYRLALETGCGDTEDTLSAFWYVIDSLKRMARNAVKKCSSCQTEKHLREFSFDSSQASGYSNRCKGCDNARRRKSPSLPTGGTDK